MKSTVSRRSEAAFGNAWCVCDGELRVWWVGGSPQTTAGGGGSAVREAHPRSGLSAWMLPMFVFGASCELRRVCVVPIEFRTTLTDRVPNYTECLRS